MHSLMGFMAATLALCAGLAAGGEPPQAADWPQWRGPNRDGVAVGSPKLLDAWPKEGPPLAWQSEWIPGLDEGGMGSPVVAGGKVFLYVNWKQPVGGGNKYRPVTAETLADAGWLPDLPEALARRIEEAWASPKRPSSSGWKWHAVTRAPDAELDAFLAGKPELDKYIKEFLAALEAADARKYGAHIRRRLCINKEKPNEGESWDNLAKLSKLRDAEFASYGEYLGALAKAGFRYHFHHKASHTSAFNGMAWDRSYAMSDTVVCLDAATGKLLWKKDFPQDRAVIERIGNDRSFGIFGACGTPAVWNGKCYAAGAMGLYCLSVQDGALVWKADREPTHAAPLAANGIVYHCGTAYHADNGSVIWQNPQWRAGAWTQLQTYASPVLWQAGGRKLLIAPNPNKWSCFEFETGKVLWTIDKSLAHFAPPMVAGDTLVVTAGEFGKQAQAYKLTPAGAEPLWKQTYGTGQGGGIVRGNHLYLCDALEAPAVWRCVDLRTGEVEWARRVTERVSESVICCPILADGKIISYLGGAHDLWYHGRKGFDVQLLKATPNGYTQLGLLPSQACPLSSPALANGRLYVRMIDKVACYDLRDRNPATAGEPLRLQYKHCFGKTIALASEQPVDRSAQHGLELQISVAGTQVERVNFAPSGRHVLVTTAKTWKAGETGTLSYPAQPGGKQEQVTFTVAAQPAPAEARFIKTDETTSGNWTGVYGSEGALLAGEAAPVLPGFAVLGFAGKQDGIWRTWAGAPLPTNDPKYLKKPGAGDARIGGYWNGDMLELDLALNDGKEHQVAIYCLDGTGNYERQTRVDVRDFETRAILDSQFVKSYRKGKYLVWNIKGRVTIQFLNVWLSEAALCGVFIDPAGASK